MRIGIIGAGKWGQALFRAFEEKNEVLITSRKKRAIKNFTTLERVLECEYLVFAISAQGLYEWLERHQLSNQKVLIASKGIDSDRLLLPSRIFTSFIPKEYVAYLSGPSFASEVMRSLPTALVVSSTNERLAKSYANAFADFIKTYVDDDIIGAEVAGAYKNIIAIAAGISDGLALGHNAKAALLARGLVEMERFATIFGKVKTETFLGLSGAGDLFLTANSTLSRNYRVGFALAQGKSLAEILEELKEVAEGVMSAEAVMKLAQKHSVYTPIAAEVFAILHGKSPKKSLLDLLARKEHG